MDSVLTCLRSTACAAKKTRLELKQLDLNHCFTNDSSIALLLMKTLVK